MTFAQEQAAPLEVITEWGGHPHLAKFMALGAMTAMLGVLLNLILGVSRVVYAMAKRGDLPLTMASVAQNAVPLVAVISTGLIIGGLTLLKDVKATWSFSAFTVLVYYAITNVAALRLPPSRRLYPRTFAWLGLFGCLTLSFWVEPQALLLGVGLLALGALWRWFRLKRGPNVH